MILLVLGMLYSLKGPNPKLLESKLVKTEQGRIFGVRDGLEIVYLKTTILVLDDLILYKVIITLYTDLL